jgi:hypothetical protein
MTLIPKSLCLDAAYMKMRLARLYAVTSGGSEALKKTCDDLTRP